MAYGVNQAADVCAAEMRRSRGPLLLIPYHQPLQACIACRKQERLQKVKSNYGYKTFIILNEH